MDRRLLAVMIFFLAVQPASAQLDQLLKGLGIGQQGGLSEAKVGSGLKEALKIGTEHTVKLTGRVDGYFTNQAIKILMPEKLQTLEKGLRLVGYGPQVDGGTGHQSFEGGVRKGMGLIIRNVAILARDRIT